MTIRQKDAELKASPTKLAPARAWLKGYFARQESRPEDLKMPLDLHGTDFQKRVWKELTRIPYGSTASYGQEAKKIRKPLPVVFFGKEFWDKILNFQPMIDYGTISPEDVKLFHYTDSVDDAFEYLTSQLTRHALQHPGGNL